MRIVLAIAVWVIMVGGLWLYTAKRELPVRIQGPAAPVEAVVDGSFSIALTPTFGVAEDPFALNTETTRQAPIEVRLNGRSLAAPESIARGETVRLEGVGPILEGLNEVFVKASPPAAEAGLDHGLRVQVLEAGVARAEKTVWADRGALVSGSLQFEYLPARGGDHDR